MGTPLKATYGAKSPLASLEAEWLNTVANVLNDIQGDHDESLSLDRYRDQRSVTVVRYDLDRAEDAAGDEIQAHSAPSLGWRPSKTGQIICCIDGHIVCYRHEMLCQLTSDTRQVKMSP